jgi:hypothetical protein
MILKADKQGYLLHTGKVHNARIMDTPEWLKNTPEFIADAGAWGIASVITAAVLFGIGLWEHYRDKSVPAFWFICLTIPLFWIGAYAAWLKKHKSVIALQMDREAPKVFLRYEQSHDSDFYNSGFFVQVEGEKKAFDVQINSEPVVGQNHKRIAMRWEVPKKPIGHDPIPVHAACERYEKDTLHLIGGISGRQIHRFFEEKKDFQNELEVTLTYKDVDGRVCPLRKFKVTSNRDYRGNFEIGCIPIDTPEGGWPTR